MLEKLSPSVVWKYFEQFCAIPHPSGQEERAADFIRNCAVKLGLPYNTDAVGNVLIRQNATDPAHTTTVILQSHLDMVPQKNADTIHDFSIDSIKPEIIGEWVKAKGTTLGADNGIGVAIALAILESSTIKHGPIEALFTRDEERGMTGAFGLTDKFLSGKKLINLDTEEESEICIGCAGGTDIKALIPVIFVEPASRQQGFSLSVTGLQGGHSGMEIHLGRANALKLMADLLSEINDTLTISLADFFGGTARNAIPREAFCVISVASDLSSKVLAIVTAFEKCIQKTFSLSDPGLRITCTPVRMPEKVLKKESFFTILNIVKALPNGVIAMSPTLSDTVQTSNNCAMIKCLSDTIQIDCMLRSSVDLELQHLKEQITHIFTQSGAAVSYGSMYPGWQPVSDSSLLATFKHAYQLIHDKSPDIVVVHAGLECGIIGSKFPGMEMISCGPTIRYAHSPDEQMHIPSVERFWKCVTLGIEMLH